MPLTLSAYKLTVFKNLEMEKLIVFQSEKITSLIRTFVHSFMPNPDRISFILHGPIIKEKLVTTTNPAPTLGELVPRNDLGWQWEHSFLYPNEQGDYSFYLAGIKQPYLLQYKLLAINARITVAKITTQRIALLSLYRHLSGTAFRQARLAQHMASHNNMIEQVFSREILSRVLSIPPKFGINYNYSFLPMLSACGVTL